MDTADFLHVFTERVGVVKDVKGKRLAFFFFFLHAPNCSRLQNVNETIITPMLIKLCWKDFNSLMNMHANLLIKLIILLKIHLSSKDIFPMILTCLCH